MQQLLFQTIKQTQPGTPASAPTAAYLPLIPISSDSDFSSDTLDDCEESNGMSCAVGNHFSCERSR